MFVNGRSAPSLSELFLVFGIDGNGIAGFALVSPIVNSFYTATKLVYLSRFALFHIFASPLIGG